MCVGEGLVLFDVRLSLQVEFKIGIQLMVLVDFADRKGRLFGVLLTGLGEKNPLVTRLGR